MPHPGLSSSPPSIDPELEYRSVEPLAVIGLLLGLVSALAFIGPLLWLLPPLGIAANLLAMRRIRHDSSRSGRSIALAGLGLSVVFAIAPAAQTASAFWILRQQPRDVADAYLEFLRTDHPEKALMLRTLPEMRELDETWAYFQENADARQDLERFVRMPIVRTMLALGDKAAIRFFSFNGVAINGSTAQVNYWYTVTFMDNGKKKTFLVGLVMERKPNPRADVSPWRVKDFYGPVDPNKLD
jgi:hypothetical protein